MTQWSAVVVLAASLAAAAAEPGSRERLDAFLATPQARGNVFAQARQFDGFDYRAALRLAVTDREGLVALLRYNDRASLIGEGAEDHAAILLALLERWGDDAFAGALQSCTRTAVATTQHFLEYGGGTAAQYPRTFSARGE